MRVWRKWTAAAILGSSAISMVATSRAEMISRCIIEIDDAVFLNGPCNYMADENGSFTIGVGGDGIPASRYFAYVLLEGEIVHASWNGFPPASRAHTPIEGLTRKGACLVSKTARICAYK